MKVEQDQTDSRNLVVRVRLETWKLAALVQDRIWDHPPEGYRVWKSGMRRNHTGGGRKCSLTVILRHMDRRCPKLEPEAAQQAFEWVEKLAS